MHSESREDSKRKGRGRRVLGAAGAGGGSREDGRGDEVQETMGHCGPLLVKHFVLLKKNTSISFEFKIIKMGTNGRLSLVFINCRVPQAAHCYKSFHLFQNFSSLGNCQI